MVHPHALRHRKKGWVLSVRQQHSRPLYPARRFRSRANNRAQRRQILLANCQFDRLPPRRHEFNLSANQSRKPRTRIGKCESSTYDRFHGIDVLGVIRDDDDMRAFFYKLMHDTMAVGRAAGVRFPPDFQAELDHLVATFPPTMKASMANDLEAGNRLELDWLAGKVVALGRKYG